MASRTCLGYLVVDTRYQKPYLPNEPCFASPSSNHAERQACVLKPSRALKVTPLHDAAASVDFDALCLRVTTKQIFAFCRDFALTAPNQHRAAKMLCRDLTIPSLI